MTTGVPEYHRPFLSWVKFILMLSTSTVMDSRTTGRFFRGSSLSRLFAAYLHPAVLMKSDPRSISPPKVRPVSEADVFPH